MSAAERSRRTNPLPSLLGWLALTFAAAAIGAWASASAATFYAALVRPAWAPPGWLFGPVWSALYLAMGIAAWRVWRARPHPHAQRALQLYVVQLIANAAWTWLYFVWHQGAWALAEVLLLWLLIAATSLSFWRVRRGAAMLLLPYLAWVGFAAALTWSTWQLNPQALG